MNAYHNAKHTSTFVPPSDACHPHTGTEAVGANFQNHAGIAKVIDANVSTIVIGHGLRKGYSSSGSSLEGLVVHQCKGLVKLGGNCTRLLLQASG